MDRYIKSYGSHNLSKPYKKNRGFFLFRIFAKKNRENTMASRNFVKNRDNITQRYLSPNRTEQKLKKRNWKKLFIIFFLFTLLITWGSLMLYLPYFRINCLEFVGLNIIEKNDIEQYIKDSYLDGKILPKNNYFLINTKKIEKDLLNKYSANSVVATKIFPKKLIIEINEKISTVIYYNGNNYYLLDKNGEIIKKISINEHRENELANEDPITLATVSSTEDFLENIIPETLPQNTATNTTTTTIQTPTTSINNDIQEVLFKKPEWRKLSNEYHNIPIYFHKEINNEIINQESLLPYAVIEFMIEWSKTINEEGIGEARYYETSNLSAGMTVIMDKAWKVYIQPKNSLINQINNLKIILSSREANPKEYIDLRYDEKVFWK